MAEFYRAHPALWLVKLVQAAVAAGGTEISFKTGSNSVLMGFHCAQAPPLPEELLVEGEVAGYLKVAIQAALASEPDLERLTLATWSEGEPAQAMCFCPGQPPRSGKLALETTLALQTRMGWGQKENHHLAVLFERSRSGWWQSLSGRIRFFIHLQALFRERLALCPVPIRLDSWRLGEGIGTPYPSVAAEYLVGPMHADVFIKELEPGFGSRIYEAFGSRVSGLGIHPRLFVRWAEIDHALFPGCESALEKTLTKFLKPSALRVLKDRKSLPPRSVGIYGRGGWGIYLDSWVQFTEHYRPQAQANAFITPGLPTRVLLILPPPSSSAARQVLLRRVVALRRGVVLETIEIESESDCEGATALVACPALRTDLSGMRVVQDEHFQQLVEFLRERARALIRDASQALQQEGVELGWTCGTRAATDGAA